MRIWIIAVGQKLPAWAQTACDEYSKRFPPDFKIELKAVKAQPRETFSLEQIYESEKERLLAAIPKGARVVVLDEKGKSIQTKQLAQKMNDWQLAAQDITLIIGGADGLHPQLKKQADEQIRLSDLTLPHAMVR
ncbi:MAG: 23S rRNA (pseudouridine(1915)-N(3))-methyltransferase RlmH, partial [Limnohabitans sp.]|nr:23S rRNA (pseudouridine(1915)-N(3))-methyltransferase RlmH [Limnohabitans sp.]